MRTILSKVLTGSMIASAALLVSACGPKADEANTTSVTDVNTTEGMGDTMTDNMTAVDGGMNGGMMANDTMMGGNTGMMGNDTGMMANDTMMSGNTTGTTGNAM